MARRQPARSIALKRRALAATLVAVLGAALFPAAISASSDSSARYLVVFNGDYALNGQYALGSGYALVPEGALASSYALGTGYALGAGAILSADYALNGLYALTGNYALTGAYALDGSYALATGSTLYALYALNDVYALLQSHSYGSLYALNPDYALVNQQILASSYALGSNYALARDYALSLVGAAGGTPVADLSNQLGVMLIDTKNSGFAAAMGAFAMVNVVGLDFGWQQYPSEATAIASGALTVVSGVTTSTTGGDPLESQQWSMQLINAPKARAINPGRRAVRVGVVDTGIDGNHIDFLRTDGTTNVDCAHGADFTALGPGIGSPFACVDNNFHGTHVAGIIGAQPNGHGVVGIAPGVTLVPIKVCDGTGSCYAGSVVEGITYAGDQSLNVINMSFFVDDNTFMQSTEFKCASDSSQEAFRKSVERAISYFRGKGGTPIAALGNEDIDLAHPPAGSNCKVVPAQTPGVTGVVALGPDSGKAAYSNYGTGAADVSAPGGDYDPARDTGSTICGREVLSTIPGNAWGCLQGTSMAAPHATGVAALIISQFGSPGPNGTWVMSPTSVQSRLQASAIDIGLKGYDECFGYGRIDALRAVTGNTKSTYDSSAPFCPEYNL